MEKPVIAISIPTGIGATIGGYAGDFGYLAREFSKYFHVAINPNAVNGGILSAVNYDMSYLEGYLFDEFLKGNIEITPKKPYETNKIGVIFDSAIPKDIINVHLNTISALKMVQGIDTVAIEYTSNPVGVEIEIQNGISVGKLTNPQTLLDSASKLIKKGAQAIAVVCYFSEDSEDENYSCANGIDPIGGIEAVISHLIAKEFNIPVAHAPAFCDIDISTKIENPKVASEMVSSTYLPCVMQGLSIAPQISKKGLISNKDIKYLIVPNDALGSIGVLSSIENGLNVITVNNKTVLNVTKDKLNIKPYLEFEDYKTCLMKIIKTMDKN
ncbi:MAG: DUF3326 domain-containing protein [Candidatus Gastranaerophilales bacterium]|nr:DUF3326 domain-containing protein [Candidatus Gastranaerophilales bacterium]